MFVIGFLSIPFFAGVFARNVRFAKIANPLTVDCLGG